MQNLHQKSAIQRTCSSGFGKEQVSVFDRKAAPALQLMLGAKAPLPPSTANHPTGLRLFSCGLPVPWDCQPTCWINEAHLCRVLGFCLLGSSFAGKPNTLGRVMRDKQRDLQLGFGWFPALCLVRAAVRELLPLL